MRILVIRFLAIGDVVLSSVLCNSLKKSFPHARVDYMVHEPSAALFENHPYIDNVISLSICERKNLFKYFKKVYQITRTNYDIIIDATSTEKSSLVCAFSKHAKYKIGRFKAKKGYFFNHKIKYKTTPEDKIQQRLQMLSPLIQDGFDIKPDHEMLINITEEEQLQMKVKMIQHGVDFGQPVIVFAASSKIAFKRWRRDYMQQLICHCIDQLQAQIILYYWGEEEAADIKHLHHVCLAGHTNVFSSLELTSSRDLAAIIVNSDMFVGNEGGPRHIAQALKTPTVAVCSPSAEKSIWLPKNEGRYVGIEWKDLPENQDKLWMRFKDGDDLYYQLYESIAPIHVIPLIDQVYQEYVLPVRLQKHASNSVLPVSLSGS